jgi:hypothetical protein
MKPSDHKLSRESLVRLSELPPQELGHPIRYDPVPSMLTRTLPLRSPSLQANAKEQSLTGNRLRASVPFFGYNEASPSRISLRTVDEISFKPLYVVRESRLAVLPRPETVPSAKYVAREHRVNRMRQAADLKVTLRLSECVCVRE